MRIRDLFETELSVTELSYTDPGIKKHLTKLGYSPAGKGKDQTTWLSPDGSILKIFGTQRGQQGFSEDQKMFSEWVKYLQIKMERLSPVPPNLIGMLEQFDIFVEEGRTYEYLIQIAKKHLGAKFNDPAIQSLFKDSLLWDTVLNLHTIAERKGWRLDLHAGNYMMRGNQVVIVDPWVASS